MATYTHDLGVATGEHVGGLLSPHGFDARPPLEQLRLAQLRQIAIDRGYEVSDFHRKDDLIAVLRSGIRMRSVAPPPALPVYGETPPAAPMRPVPQAMAALPPVTEADEEAARESMRSELRMMKFMKLKAVAKAVGLECPGGMTKAQKHALMEEIIKRTEAGEDA